MAETGHIFEQWARHLEAKASGIIMALVVAGGIVGAGLGSVPLLRLSNAVVPHHLGYATLLIGAAAGAYLGWSLGQRRATGLRLQAEVARRQFQVEQSLIRRMMQLAPTPPAHQAAPAPVAPAPVAPPAVVPPPPPPAPAPVPPPLAPAPAPVPVTPLLTAPAPAAPAVPPVVSPIPAPPPEPPPAAAYAPQPAVQPPLTGTDY